MQLSATTTTFSGRRVCPHNDSNVAPIVRVSSWAGTSTVRRNGFARASVACGSGSLLAGSSGSSTSRIAEGPSGVSTRAAHPAHLRRQRRRNPPVAGEHPHRRCRVQRGQTHEDAGHRRAGGQDQRDRTERCRRRRAEADRRCPRDLRATPAIPRPPPGSMRARSAQLREGSTEPLADDAEAHQSPPSAHRIAPTANGQHVVAHGRRPCEHPACGATTRGRALLPRTRRGSEQDRTLRP